MNAADLLSDLAGLGIRLEIRDDRLRYFPRQAMTHDLLVRLRAHKAQLLLIPAEAGERCDTDDATSIPPPALEGMGTDGWPESSIEPNQLPACAACGNFELWRSAAGDPFGRKAGSWRCLTCDAPAIDPRGPFELESESARWE